MKRLLFLVGLALAALAFLASGAELAAHAMGAERGSWLPARDVLRAVAPALYLSVSGGPMWPLLEYALAVPGWLLFGAPGFVLMILFRGVGGKIDPADAQSYQDHEDALFLFDELSAAAQRDGYLDLGDDIHPSDHPDIDPAPAHYGENPISPEDLPERDYLLGPSGPAPRRTRDQDDDDNGDGGGDTPPPLTHLVG
ncbi:MAG: hypothetical protein HQL36_07220 [Alphaproteobacteria bacterium]|nr:hypothetical protein [Alphaproteobacteria bacterium]MBF0252065.1 hypothetical protein [Alphaproteobacteria bacterium]